MDLDAFDGVVLNFDLQLFSLELLNKVVQGELNSPVAGWIQRVLVVNLLNEALFNLDIYIVLCGIEKQSYGFYF